MKKYIIILVTLTSLIFSQSDQPYPPLELVSIPTAGTLPKGTYTYETILSNLGLPTVASMIAGVGGVGSIFGMPGTKALS